MSELLLKKQLENLEILNTHEGGVAFQKNLFKLGDGEKILGYARQALEGFANRGIDTLSNYSERLKDIIYEMEEKGYVKQAVILATEDVEPALRYFLYADHTCVSTEDKFIDGEWRKIKKTHYPAKTSRSDETEKQIVSVVETVKKGIVFRMLMKEPLDVELLKKVWGCMSEESKSEVVWSLKDDERKITLEEMAKHVDIPEESSIETYGPNHIKQMKEIMKGFNENNPKGNEHRNTNSRNGSSRGGDGR